MKWIKKVIAKITGVFKYLKHFGKVIQTLKALSTIIPQIMPLVPADKRPTMEELSENLIKILVVLEKTEKYLNDLGIETNEIEVRSTKRLALKKQVAVIEGIAESM